MKKDDSELWGSMSDLWVIFELPTEENKEDREDGCDDDDDTISVLGQSVISDCMSLGTSSTHGECSRPLLKNPTKIHPCKRIDRNPFRSVGGITKEPSHRSMDGVPMDPTTTIATTTCCSDELDLTEHSNDEDCETVDSSGVVYFRGDRWSPCVPPKKKVHVINSGTLPSLVQDEPSNSAAKKLDQIPCVPRRKPVISVNYEEGGEHSSLPHGPLGNRAA